MIIAGFVEGAPLSRGGIGLVGVPPILKSLAVRGHKVVLIMSEPPNPSCVTSIVPDAAAVLECADGKTSFGIVTIKGWSNWAFSPAIVWRFRRLLRTADFVSLHSLYSFPVLAGYLMARFYGKPYGVWTHGVLAPFQRTLSARKKWVYDRLFANRILDNASVLFYTATGEREEAKELNLRPPSVIIPHGIDVNEFQPLPPRGAFRRRFLGGHDGPLVLFLARIGFKKGLDILIEAMKSVVARIPDAKLAIVGPPDPIEFGDQVREWVAASGVSDHISLTGPLGPEGRLEALADADVFTLPSYAENFGFSIFEAMASRVPVVVSDTLNFAGEIAACEAGFSVPRIPEELASAIVRLIDQPKLRREMGENGLLLAQKYSWEQNGIKLERTITDITNHGSSPVKLMS